MQKKLIPQDSSRCVSGDRIAPTHPEILNPPFSDRKPEISGYILTETNNMAPLIERKRKQQEKMEVIVTKTITKTKLKEKSHLKLVKVCLPSSISLLFSFSRNTNIKTSNHSKTTTSPTTVCETPFNRFSYNSYEPNSQGSGKEKTYHCTFSIH